MATKPTRVWSWKGHFAIVIALAVIAGVITALVKTRVFELGASASGIEFSHADLEKDFLTLLWASVGAFIVLSSVLLAAGLRKGLAAAVPYVVGIVAIPAAWVLLDKYL